MEVIFWLKCPGIYMPCGLYGKQHLHGENRRYASSIVAGMEISKYVRGGGGKFVSLAEGYFLQAAWLYWLNPFQLVFRSSPTSPWEKSKIWIGYIFYNDFINILPTFSTSTFLKPKFISMNDCFQDLVLLVLTTLELTRLQRQLISYLKVHVITVILSSKLALYNDF